MLRGMVHSLTNTPEIVDVTDPTAVAWAGLAAIAVVGFMLRVLSGIKLVRNHPIPVALVLSVGGAFLFGNQVWDHWQVLLAQGISVAMGATGATAVVNDLSKSGNGIHPGNGSR